MMKKGFIILLLVSVNSFCFAQSPQSFLKLKHKLASAKQDTSRALLMATLSLYYNYSLNPDSSIYYAKKAYILSNKIHFPKGEVAALSMESYTQDNVGNLPRSMELALRALQIAKDHHLQKTKEAAAALLAIAGNYHELKDYSKSLDYERQMRAVVLRISGHPYLGYAEINMADDFIELNQLDSAIYYLKRTDSIFRRMGHREAGVPGEFGDIERKSGHYPGALKLYRKSLEVAIENKEWRSVGDNYINIAKTFQKTNHPDSAIFYATAGLTAARHYFQKDETMEAASLLAALYEPDDSKTALYYLKVADTVKDSLYGSRSIQAVETIIRQENEQQQAVESNRIAYKNKIKQYILFTGLAILLLIAISLFKNSRSRRKANIALYQKNKEIETQRDHLESTLSELKSTQRQLIQSEKMASLGELTAGIAHEIQNPLNFVNNFSEVNRELIGELKAERVKPPKERNDQQEDDLLRDIDANEEKILHHGKRADAIVKGMLQHSRGSSGQKEPTDINALADEYLRLSYHGMRAKDKFFNAMIKTDFDETISKVNIVPQDIGRVLLNLYNNAFFAVSLNPKRKAKDTNDQHIPTVWVSTKKEGSEVIIRVRDNGPGIPDTIKDKIFQPFFTTKPTGEGTGLGLSLSYDIIKAHDGEIKIETKEGEGAEFVVSVPDG